MWNVLKEKTSSLINVTIQCRYTCCASLAVWMIVSYEQRRMRRGSNPQTPRMFWAAKVSELSF